MQRKRALYDIDERFPRSTHGERPQPLRGISGCRIDDESYEACVRQTEETSRLLVCCNKINDFSESFAPYFDMINVFIQAKPEWLSVFWGSIRLIFQVRASASQIFQSDPIHSLAATM
jgi:hypothetical protein